MTVPQGREESGGQGLVESLLSVHLANAPGYLLLMLTDALVSLL
jgi:hypothetical protein